MEPVTLLLSPHLDDAILSCPAFIQRAPNPLIATFFSSGSATLYRQRRAEDRVAAKVLNARTTHLALPDAPFRSARYQTFSGLIFGRATSRQDATTALNALVERHNPALVLSPLAIGNHVDHRIIRDAALVAVPPQILRFYEDRPYAFIPEQIHHALGLTRIDEYQPPEYWKRYFATTYIRNYLRGLMTQRQLARAWSRVPPFPKPLRIAQTVEPVNRELTRTIEAIFTYKTQVSDLFRDRKEARSLYGSHPEIQYRLDYH